jgi:hypothetical protein
VLFPDFPQQQAGGKARRQKSDTGAAPGSKLTKKPKVGGGRAAGALHGPGAARAWRCTGLAQRLALGAPGAWPGAWPGADPPWTTQAGALAGTAYLEAGPEAMILRKVKRNWPNQGGWFDGVITDFNVATNEYW